MTLDEDQGDIPCMVLVSDEELYRAPQSTNVISPSRLTSFHTFLALGSLPAVRSVRSSHSGRYVVVHVPNLYPLVSQCPFFTRAELQRIAFAHHVRSRANDTKEILYRALASHVCDFSCDAQYFLFETLSAERVVRYDYICQHARLFAALEETGNITHANNAVPVQQSVEDYIPPIQTVFSINQAAESLDFPAGDSHIPYEKFPELCSDDAKLDMIREFQENMDVKHYVYDACAVCDQKKFPSDLVIVDAGELDLELLRNDNVPCHIWPENYNFDAYDRAFLSPRGMHDTDCVSDISICRGCLSVMEKGKQPPDAIANYQYYGYERLPAAVANAFKHATMHEKLLVAACSATNVSHIISEKKGGVPGAPQRYCQNNVAIIPQDVGTLSRLLPPSRDDVNFTMCVLFVGKGGRPSLDTIRSMEPLLVSKRRVEIILRFLVENNPYYRDANVSFSQRNLNALCSGPGFLPGEDVGVPSTLEVQYLPFGDATAEAVNSGYEADERNDFLIPESESYTEVTGFSNTVSKGDGHQSSKVRALQWVLDHKPYIAVQPGSKLFPDRDPRMLTFVFPHLDPWGIGGFNHALRSGDAIISMQHQTRNLLMRYDSPFERDPNFAYVCWNAVQKLEAARSLQFRTQASNLTYLADEISQNKTVIEDMNERWMRDEKLTPTSRQERRVAAILAKLRLVAKDLKGSNGRRIALRNQIRGLLKANGSPALFITLNPSDIHHKLMHILSGQSESTFEDMDKFQRAKNVAQHPAAAAIFFDIMIKAFRDYILRYGREDPGVFGTCDAYFGTVEAQGRGTLHCHMLVWIKGNPNPQALRDRIAEDSSFKDAMFGWLESIIKCELPGMEPMLGEEPSGPWPKPALDYDTRATDAPFLEEDMSEQDHERFQESFKHFVNDLAVACNWHEHKATCWKYLSDDEPHDDAHCRMRVDGTTRAFTELDEESSSILLRRLHPWINNYNDLVLFLMKCNMDIKYIGSGQAAKALVYYVTDYVTKGSLPLHLGLQSLCWAIRQNEAKYDGPEKVDADIIKRSLMVKVVNAMMGRQEISHQQVMSYLVGGGDSYTSHKFRTLYWGEFDRYLRSQGQPDAEGISCQDGGAHCVPDLTEVGAQPEEVDDLDEVDVSVTTRDAPFSLSKKPEEISAAFTEDGIVQHSLLADYRLRSSKPVFNTMALWDFVATTVLEPCTKASKIFNPRVSRGKLLNDEHPLYRTHVNKLNTGQRVVPVLVGPQIPRKDTSEEDTENWCRLMLLLFKPWREPEDLRGIGQTWKNAFEAYAFAPHLANVIGNMNIEQECKDARQAYDSARRARKVAPLIQSSEASYQLDDNSDLFELAVKNDERFDMKLLKGNIDDDPLKKTNERLLNADSRVIETLRNIENAGVLVADTRGEHDESLLSGFNYPTDRMDEQKSVMEAYGRNKRPIASPRNETRTEAERKSYGDYDPRTYIDRMQGERARPPPLPPVPGESSESAYGRAADAVIEAVLKDLNISDNLEQEAAVRIVGEHLLRGRAEQLMMYVGGEGGTGKSHVVKAIVELFSRCQVRSRILLSAPTGIASVLISGYTIHALTFLPKAENQRVNWEALTEIWKDADYLIIDEVSMIGAIFLANVNERLRAARGWKDKDSDKPFGGVNMIFLGDFGQLMPVSQSSLFANDLVRHLTKNRGQNISGQTSMYGAYLWRQLNRVIGLKKNWRHAADPQYAAMLSRIRRGQGRDKRDSNHSRSDYEILLDRQLNVLQHNANKNGTDLSRFRDCPIIVAEKTLRDAINVKMAIAKASTAGKPLHYFVAVDKRHGKPFEGDQRRKMLTLRSSLTHDSLGQLPLFEGMKVMITDNIDIGHKTVNGAEGVVQHIKWDDMADGTKIATCVYVHVPGSGLNFKDIPIDVVPVFPTKTSVDYIAPDKRKFSFSRWQIPLLPAYAYTDYKAQGRSLETVIVDLAGCRSAQSAYVMLSRVKTLEGLAILRWFPTIRVTKPLQHDLRNEMDRLERLSKETLGLFL